MVNSKMEQALMMLQHPQGVAPREFREAAQQHTQTYYTAAVEKFLPSLISEGRVLVLAGPPARGKTYAAYYALCLGFRLNSTSQPGRMYSFRELISQSITDSGTFREGLRRTGLVAWDDLGTEHRDEKGYSQGVICEMIDHRYTHRLPTIITTNISRADASEFYNERILSRLKGWGWWYQVPPNQAPDMR